MLLCKTWTTSQSVFKGTTFLVPRKTSTITAMATNRSVVASKRKISADEARISLVFALASQASSVSQRLLLELANESAKYLFPRRFQSSNLEEALMSVPDLETVKFTVLRRTEQYEIREVEFEVPIFMNKHSTVDCIIEQPYFVAETTMPGQDGFDFGGSSQGFNVLAEYLFGKNNASDKMEMTTPVITRKAELNGEKMEMTTPVITKQVLTYCLAL
ncbi:hypothetical protein IFM89_031070 [Coptis chinensis]|uniref:Uncharacterized protein n=1 Tax=Coptis chinensis TaxID=261450 RepID=A0A835HA95_9MAGN|nr:hypothetical protein IFM89_031070 [Coptis chinensis]